MLYLFLLLLCLSKEWKASGVSRGHSLLTSCSPTALLPRADQNGDGAVRVLLHTSNAKPLFYPLVLLAQEPWSLQPFPVKPFKLFVDWLIFQWKSSLTNCEETSWSLLISFTETFPVLSDSWNESEFEAAVKQTTLSETFLASFLMGEQSDLWTKILAASSWMTDRICEPPPSKILISRTFLAMRKVYKGYDPMAGIWRQTLFKASV